MRVRRFVADTAQEAVARVKRELGDDALILNSRSYKEGGFLGLFGKKRCTPARKFLRATQP